MRILRSDLAACRAVIAVAALYALALQIVLGGMIGVRPLDPAHILCLQDTESSEGRQNPAAPVHLHLACCTAAHVVPPLDAPAPTASPILWPVRRATVTLWRPETVATPRAPPGICASARAPPVL